MHKAVFRKEDAIGKTVSGFAEDTSVAAIAFTDGTVLVLSADADDDRGYIEAFDDLELWQWPNPWVLENAGIITADERAAEINRRMTAAADKAEQRDRAEYERLKRKYEPAAAPARGEVDPAETR